MRSLQPAVPVSPALSAVLSAVAGAIFGAFMTGCAQLDVQPRYGLADIDGEFGISSTNVTGQADLNQMGLEEEDAFGARADFKWGLPHFIVSGQGSEHEGDGTLSAEVSQGPITIPVGSNVSSSLDLGLYSGLLLFDLLPTENFELALGAGVSVIDFDLSIVDQGSGDTVQSDEVLLLPVIAANAGLKFGSFELALLVSGFDLSYDNDSGTFIDGDAFARWRFLGGDSHVRASLIAGWRATLLDVDLEESGDSIEGEVELSGPYVGLEFTL